ncbi:MAG: hypothetical protein M5U25_00080 [Planctomycetota bacterium]|nr:hypothetical protein [Planctomycetota bacterium]
MGKAAKAKKIKVSMKKKAGVPQTETLKITKIGYYKKTDPNKGSYVEEDITSVQSANGDEANIDLPADADTSKAIYVKVYTYDKQTALEVIPAEPPLNKNFCYMDDGAQTIVSVETGGGAVCSIDGEDEVTMLELAAEMNLSAEDFTEPDLMFWCADLIETGTILFCPVGQFEFGSLPDAIHVFDADGADMVNAGKIELGDPSVTPRGDLSIPVLEVDETLPAFGVIVRGVSVDMADNADENSVHCYTMGGTALRKLDSDTCPIARGATVMNNWELISWGPSYKLGWIEARLAEEETVTIGAPFITTVSGEGNSGYLDGIVIEANAANDIKNGKIVIRPVSGWQFETAEGNADTKVYLINADTGEDLYQEELSASIGLSSAGDLVVTLNNIQTYCSTVRVKVVITGILAAYTAPVAWGVGCKFQCFGPALRAPLRQPRTIIEGESPEVSSESGPLPQTAIEVTDWTPVAVTD